MNLFTAIGITSKEKNEVGDFLDHVSKNFRKSDENRLRRKIEILLDALRSSDGRSDPVFAKIQEVFSRYQDSPWTRKQKKEVDQVLGL